MVEQNHPQSSLEHLDIKGLSEDQLYAFITHVLVSAENERYSAGNTAEHALLFLIGGPENDVSVAKTMDGSPVYTSQPGHPKAPEITEATAAISAHFEVERSLPRVLSEISDVSFNLAKLTVLDEKFAQEYRACISKIANSLGFTVENLLLISVTKYKHRLIDAKEKKPQEEDELIKRLLGAVAPPSDAEISQAYRVINEIGNNVLRPRVVQWRYMKS